MQTSSITEHFNEAQLEVVTAPNRNLLVIAGAGSGKTRVLVHRIAWLIQEQGFSANEILAVTFTNKAAREMRSRLEELLAYSVHSMWVGTFHGLAHRLLRQHWQAAKLMESFQIIDSDDQLRMIKRIQKQLELDESNWPPKQAQWFINKEKDEGRRSKDVYDDGTLFINTMLRVYRAYEKQCEQGGLVDFSELLLRAYELLQNNSELLEFYHQRFRYLLVDEFQDTNALQYAWLKLITAKNSCVMIVGDDDQSIYSWRGAQIGNIHNFSKDFPNTQTIRLEQNYRSTKTILSAANAVISNNNNRMGKDLWTEGDTGDPISLYSAFNETDEARFVVSTIEQWVALDHPRRSVALLYRSNAQSRVLEEELIQAGIPYRIYGGLKFFDRAEIKDALAYLRLISNRHDDAAFERVINTPPRGIGNSTLQIIRDHARQHELSLWRSCETLCQQNLLSGRAFSALQNFLQIINHIDTETQDYQLADLTEYMLQKVQLIEHYGKEGSENAQSRVENLQELIQATKAFDPRSEFTQDLPPLPAFLSHVSLDTSDNQADPHEDSVQLMTLHAAKGLEFDLVIICGVEEGLFPHHMSSEDPNRLEEERRLCYVGMTRAKRKLILCYAETRRMYGRDNYHTVSRFVLEIPSEYIVEVRPKMQVSRPLSYQSPARSTSNVPKSTKAMTQVNLDTGLKLGQHVRHPKFGDGIVLNFEGQGDATQIQVQFAKVGTKWLVASFAKLETA
jgi:DNA helicase-2/ATP-dependent DNA helicase PcrA